MNRSTASKYANILSVLGEAENLMILDILIEDSDYVCVTELAKATSLTDRKVIGFCERLQDLGLVSQDNRNGLTYYKFSNSSNARMLEVVWKKVF